MEQKLILKDVLGEIKVDLVKEHYTHFDLEVIDEIKQKMYKVNYNLADFYNLIHDLSYKDLFDAEYLKTQKFIGGFFRELDKFIELEKTELKLFQEMKKGFLHKMFV